jgi:hypothetical protein
MAPAAWPVKAVWPWRNEASSRQRCCWQWQGRSRGTWCLRRWRSAWPLARGSQDVWRAAFGARRRAASACRGSRAAAATSSGQQKPWREIPPGEASGRSSRATESMTSGPDAISFVSLNFELHKKSTTLKIEKPYHLGIKIYETFY